jgi:hypothetical protein
LKEQIAKKALIEAKYPYIHLIPERDMNTQEPIPTSLNHLFTSKLEIAELINLTWRTLNTEGKRFRINFLLYALPGLIWLLSWVAKAVFFKTEGADFAELLEYTNLYFYWSFFVSIFDLYQIDAILRSASSLDWKPQLPKFSYQNAVFFFILKCVLLVFSQLSRVTVILGIPFLIVSYWQYSFFFCQPSISASWKHASTLILQNAPRIFGTNIIIAFFSFILLLICFLPVFLIRQNFTFIIGITIFTVTTPYFNILLAYLFLNIEASTHITETKNS